MNLKNCYLRSKENSLLLKHLQHSCLEKTTNGLRIDNSLDIWILEAKGLPAKKKYYKIDISFKKNEYFIVDIMLKYFLMMIFTGKQQVLNDVMFFFWGENFIFKDLPEGLKRILLI